MQVSQLKDMMRFQGRGKLIPIYIGPFDIPRRVGDIVYELALPSPFSAIHLIFHVSMLHPYILDELHVLQSDSVKLDECLTFH